MARAGEEIYNPVQNDWIMFRETAQDTSGQLLRACPAPRVGTDGKTASEGRALAHPLRGGRRSFNPWKPITVANWYGGGQRTVEIVSDSAIWYSTGLPAVPVRWVVIRDPKEEFETQALLCTDLDADPERIISWFVKRWQMEATFQEVRQRLGFETQRHWSKRAIQRTAPALLGLYSVVTLLANQYMAKGGGSVRRTAWYDKTCPTFSDALALVRRRLWAQEATFCGSVWKDETVKVPLRFIERLTDTVCYAA